MTKRIESKTTFKIIFYEIENNLTIGNHALQKRRSISRNSLVKSPFDGLLIEKLNEIINEGILDSILPFICAANLSAQNTRANVGHVCALKSKQSPSLKFISPRIHSNALENHNANKNGGETSANLTVSTKDRQNRRKSTQSSSLLSEYDYLLVFCVSVNIFIRISFFL